MKITYIWAIECIGAILPLPTCSKQISNFIESYKVTFNVIGNLITEKGTSDLYRRYGVKQWASQHTRLIDAEH